MLGIMADKAERYAFFKTRAQIEADNDVRATNNLRRYITYCQDHEWYERMIFGQHMLDDLTRGRLEEMIRDEDNFRQFGIATLASFGGEEGW